MISVFKRTNVYSRFFGFECDKVWKLSLRAFLTADVLTKGSFRPRLTVIVMLSSVIKYRKRVDIVAVCTGLVVGSKFWFLSLILYFYLLVWLERRHSGILLRHEASFFLGGGYFWWRMDECFCHSVYEYYTYILQ